MPPSAYGPRGEFCCSAPRGTERRYWRTRQRPNRDSRCWPQRGRRYLGSTWGTLRRPSASSSVRCGAGRWAHPGVLLSGGWSLVSERAGVGFVFRGSRLFFQRESVLFSAGLGESFLLALDSFGSGDEELRAGLAGGAMGGGWCWWWWRGAGECGVAVCAGRTLRGSGGVLRTGGDDDFGRDHSIGHALRASASPFPPSPTAPPAHFPSTSNPPPPRRASALPPSSSSTRSTRSALGAAAVAAAVTAAVKAAPRWRAAPCRLS